MDRVVREIIQIHTKVSAVIPHTTFRHVVRRCYLSWGSIHGKYRRAMEHINSELVPDLSTITVSQKSMVTIGEVTFRKCYHTPGFLTSMVCLEKQNQKLSYEVNTLLKAVPEWGAVPQSIHDSLSVYATTLERQRMDLALISLVPLALASPRR